MLLSFLFTSHSFFGESAFGVCKSNKLYYESWGRRDWRVISRWFTFKVVQWMSGLSRGKHLHRERKQLHGSSQEGKV